MLGISDMKIFPFINDLHPNALFLKWLLLLKSINEMNLRVVENDFIPIFYQNKTCI